MKKIMATLLVAIMFLSVPALGWAAASPWTQAPSYSEKVKAKLDFGLKNVLGGWTELLTKPANAKNDLRSIPKALWEGVANAVVYTLGGALHVVTFPLASVDVPLPNDGVQF